MSRRGQSRLKKAECFPVNSSSARLALHKENCCSSRSQPLWQRRSLNFQKLRRGLCRRPNYNLLDAKTASTRSLRKARRLRASAALDRQGQTAPARIAEGLQLQNRWLRQTFAGISED